jgi:hypothetical protein
MMTQARLELIKARHMAKKEEYLTYWLTRNSIQGYLSDAIDVWTARPIRTMHDGDVMWIPDSPRTDTYWGRWTFDQAYKQVRAGIPEDDRMCVKVGR